MSNVFRLAFPALAVTILGVVRAPAARAQESRPMSVQLSNDATLLVVGDPARSSMAIYRIAGNSVTLISTRDLGKDLTVEPVKTVAGPPASSPSADVPGQDPPDFKRPEGVVRIASSYSKNDREESWNSTYLVKGTVAGIYEKMRAQFKDWSVSSEQIMQPEYFQAGLQVARGDSDVGVSIRRSAMGDAWVQLIVQESRKRH